MQLIRERVGQESGNSPQPVDRAHDQAFIGIDFVEVAESHVLFFGRVKDYLNGEPLDAGADLSEFDRNCELERWLQGVGTKRFGQLRSFARLRDAHAEFHNLATDVLAMIHAGSWIAAEHMRKNELSQALRRVLITLTELNESIKKQGAGVS